MDQGSKFTVTLTSVVPSAEYQITKLLLKSVRDINKFITLVVKIYSVSYRPLIKIEC